MKVLFIMLLVSSICFSQGRSISLVKKSFDPVVTISNDTIKVGEVIHFQEGSNDDASFKYVMVLNGLNEPLYQADSKTAFTKQPIKFFKIQDGAVYIFTKYYSINLEAALLKKEFSIIKK